MNIAIKIFHIMTSVALIALVLLQSSKGGLGSAFGGGEVYRTRRGAERVVFFATIVLSILFLVTSIATLFLQK